MSQMSQHTALRRIASHALTPTSAATVATETAMGATATDVIVETRTATARTERIEEVIEATDERGATTTTIGQIERRERIEITNSLKRSNAGW